MMRKWEHLPEFMQVDEIKSYYDILIQHRCGLILKRIFDLVVGIILLIILSPIFVVLGIAIKLDSQGPVMFRQVRVTIYGKKFKILKFRTMIEDADKRGTEVTTKEDPRVTKVGKILRRYRLDELPQLFNVLTGDMSFVGPRPEVVKYVKCYTNEMRATLLMRAGITSIASIEYKDEEKLLESSYNAEVVYVQQVLPEKMKYNLQAIKDFSFLHDILIMFRTAIAVLK